MVVGGMEVSLRGCLATHQCGELGVAFVLSRRQARPVDPDDEGVGPSLPQHNVFNAAEGEVRAAVPPGSRLRHLPEDSRGHAPHGRPVRREEGFEEGLCAGGEAGRGGGRGPLGGCRHLGEGAKEGEGEDGSEEEGGEEGEEEEGPEAREGRCWGRDSMDWVEGSSDVPMRAKPPGSTQSQIWLSLMPIMSVTPKPISRPITAANARTGKGIGVR